MIANEDGIADAVSIHLCAAGVGHSYGISIQTAGSWGKSGKGIGVTGNTVVTGSVSANGGSSSGTLALYNGGKFKTGRQY